MNDGTATYKDKYDVDKIDVWHCSCRIEQEACEYFTDGMKRLVEHDREANVSYIETLRCYLANSMSIAKTAKALFIHRSTLLDRIGRIERELGCDLKNPDERLRIEILLKAQQIYDAMGS